MCKRFSNQHANKPDAEVEIKNNASYGQVNLDSQPCQKARLPTNVVQQKQDDNVYEMCSNI